MDAYCQRQSVINGLPSSISPTCASSSTASASTTDKPPRNSTWRMVMRSMSSSSRSEAQQDSQSNDRNSHIFIFDSVSSTNSNMMNGLSKRSQYNKNNESGAVCGCSALLVFIQPKCSEVLLVVVPSVLEQAELRLAHRLTHDSGTRDHAGHEERIVEDAEKPLVLAGLWALHLDYLLLPLLFLHRHRRHVFFHFVEVKLQMIVAFHLLWLLALEDV